MTSFNRSFYHTKDDNQSVAKDKLEDKIKNKLNDVSNNLKGRTYASKLRANSKNLEIIDSEKFKEFKNTSNNSNIVSNLITSFSLDHENKNLKSDNRNESKSQSKSRSNSRFRAI